MKRSGKKHFTIEKKGKTFLFILFRLLANCVTRHIHRTINTFLSYTKFFFIQKISFLCLQIGRGNLLRGKRARGLIRKLKRKLIEQLEVF